MSHHNPAVDPGSSQSLAALVTRIDRDQLTETLLCRLRAEIPGYARLPESVIRGQVVEVIRQNVDLCLDWVAGGGAPEAARLEDFRWSAKNRATEGMPLEDLLRAYRIGAIAAWRVLAAATLEEEAENLPYAAELVMTYLDAVSGIVASAYLDDRQHLVSEQERGLRGLFDAMVAGDALDADHHELAARLGFQVGDTFTVFALAISREAPRAHAQTAARLRTSGVLAVTEGDRVVGLSAPRRDLPVALPAGAVAVIDGGVARVDLAESLTDVRLGMDIALRRGCAGVVALSTLALDLLLGHAPRVAVDLRRRMLDPLGNQGAGARGDLLHTVSTYIALRRDRRATAAALHVHPNTLDHRLHRIEQLAGVRLDDPHDLAMIVLALRAAR